MNFALFLVHQEHLELLGLIGKYFGLHGYDLDAWRKTFDMQHGGVPGVVLNPKGTLNLLHDADLAQVQQLIRELAFHFVHLSLELKLKFPAVFYLAELILDILEIYNFTSIQIYIIK